IKSQSLKPHPYWRMLWPKYELKPKGIGAQTEDRERKKRCSQRQRRVCAATSRTATCLPYIGGQAKVPTPDFCTGLKQVLKDNKKCLCVIIRDRNDLELGLQINVTLCFRSAFCLPCPC
ncbi:protein yls3, partial [Quercus suber]